MKRARAGFALSFVLGSSGCEPTAPASRDVCAAARSFEVAAHAGSRVTGDRIAPGAAVTCERALAAHRPVVLALQRTPATLRPARVLLHLDPRLEAGAPPLRGLEVQRETAALLIESAALPGLASRDGSESLWLHELAHVRAAGARPRAELARRLFAALEEGIADYSAAVVAGSPRVGAEGLELRDLSAPPALRASEWAMLALPSAFEPHRFGWTLAAELYRTEARPGALLEDVLDALAAREPWPEAANTPGAALDELVGRCRERSRAAFAGALARWLPRELQQG
jgi:hypothetical protein